MSEESDQTKPGDAGAVPVPPAGGEPSGSTVPETLPDVPGLPPEEPAPASAQPADADPRKILEVLDQAAETGGTPEASKPADPAEPAAQVEAVSPEMMISEAMRELDAMLESITAKQAAAPEVAPPAPDELPDVPSGGGTAAGG